MKVAFPLRNKKELAIDFGHCEAIGIFDDLSYNIVYLPVNEGKVSDKSDVITTVSHAGVECVVSPYYSCAALRDFGRLNIKTFKARSEKVEDNTRLFISKVLNLFNIFDILHLDNHQADCENCGAHCGARG